ncbi:diphosphomevalonate/mevalonate 3,5-bisphosphate decarboxylase family protein [Candidatus Oscillochloris fontis]|uniref:diphosphomevalonate/mevalonate 3,5-bisphosphate decarboxylase family protein n=1 Tax=Candidatus Oscillochloris fontis TaxID=2496868 RepID=UPI00101C50BE|nr:GHMP kinase [Candidatus Oscillochloris fontis]
MTTTTLPVGFSDMLEVMRTGHERILAALAEHGVHYEPYPERIPDPRPTGRAAARAYPMQGVLKYHGLSDWHYRIAYLPSISLNNSAAHTTTYVEFDPDLEADCAEIGGITATGRDLDRVVQTLNAVRELTGCQTRARVMSRNVLQSRVAGKGLGTSASASAALAAAALAALYGPELASNRRFLSCFARLLAGSGCRSAAGGLALWLSYPSLSHADSFAVRLDGEGQMEHVSLVTVPIDSSIGLKTESAHHDAPESSLFRSWMQSRSDEIIECLAAIRGGDWRTVGQLAEMDSMRLHGITMSGSRENKLVGWEPENITLFRMCNDLRERGIPVYASTDTGPTVVFITHRDHEDALVAAIQGLGLGLETIRGKIAGPANLIDPDEALAEIGVNP